MIDTILEILEYAGFGMFFAGIIALLIKEVISFIITSEPYRPYLCLYAIHNGKEMTRFLNEMTDYWREKRGVRESDFHHF